MSLKVDEFLEPWLTNANELSHTLADSARPTYVDRRYEMLGETELWHSFNSDDIHQVPKIYRYLQTEFTSCPGAFDSHDPDVKGGKNTVILPDWIALEGDYKPEDENFPDLEQLALCGKIVAVGDTKLVSPLSDTSRVERKVQDVIDGTHSCHRNYLAQVQHYAKMLRTRYGFILTNKELVLAQFLREEDSVPRPNDQRGLRSSNTVSLNPGLASDFQSSDAYESTEPVTNLPSPSVIPQPKRRHGSSDDLAARRLPSAIDDQQDTYIDGLPSSPPKISEIIEGMHSSPRGHHRAMEQLGIPRKVGWDAPSSSPLRETGIRQVGLVSEPVSSSPQFLSSELGFSHSSDTPYMSSERDHDIGKVLIRSFRIPNQCDKDHEQQRNGLHPAKALFVMLLQASIIGPSGRHIDKDEVSFSGLRSESDLDFH
ncbi:unnamed protein product [Penicillium manginii]